MIGRRTLVLMLVVVAAGGFAAGYFVRGMSAGSPVGTEPPVVPAPSGSPHRNGVPRRAESSPAPAELGDADARMARLIGLQAKSVSLEQEFESRVDDRPLTVDFEPASGVSVRGRCVDDDGEPVPGVTVHVPSGESVAAGANGRFELRKVPCDANAISLSPRGGRLAWQRVPLRAAVGGMVDQGDVVLHAGTTLRGRFVDLDGRAVVGARVVLHVADAGWEAMPTVTDESGRFVYEHVGDGFCVVSGRSTNCALDGGDHDAWLHLPRRDGNEIVLRVRSAHYVRLAVVDENAGPVPIRAGRLHWYALDDPSESEETSWTDSPGWDHFRFPVRAGAVYEVQFETPGCLPSVQRIEGGEEYDRHVKLVLRQAPR